MGRENESPNSMPEADTLVSEEKRRTGEREKEKTESSLPLSPIPHFPTLTRAESPVLAELLEIAHGYFAAGAVHQAMEIYFELASQHRDEPEGARALLRLLEIAEQFAHAGKLHQARALYERLV